MGVEFSCVEADVDESCRGSGDEQVRELALRKALFVAREMPNARIIGADTLVECESEVLGKPRDETDAARMLAMLAGKWHSVHTGLALIRPGRQPLVHVETSRVHFTPMTDADIAAYIRTGEPMDKAGAYGIQGYAGQFIDKIEGCYFTIVGLPMARLRCMLAAD